MKALEILYTLISSGNDDVFANKNTYEKLTFIAEAIEELEDLENRSCDNCKFGKFGVDSIGIEVECTLNWDCSRGKAIDKWESKDEHK
jgi:hypothetical protein